MGAIHSTREIQKELVTITRDLIATLDKAVAEYEREGGLSAERVRDMESAARNATEFLWMVEND